MATHLKNQRVGFLLGAGVSLPCGAPTTAQLTEELTRQSVPYNRCTDGRYSPVPNGVATATTAIVLELDDVQRLLHNLRERVDVYYADRVSPAGCRLRPVNYEDLAYLCIQVLETLDRNRDNPAVGPFVRELVKELDTTRDALYDTAREAINLISDHLTVHLAKLSPAPGHLACIRDACTALDPAYRLLTLPLLRAIAHDLEFDDSRRSVAGFLAHFDAIFTLNQDLLLEFHNYATGFSDSDWLGSTIPG
jgi:hypothetical protein